MPWLPPCRGRGGQLLELDQVAGRQIDDGAGHAGNAASLAEHGVAQPDPPGIVRRAVRPELADERSLQLREARDAALALGNLAGLGDLLAGTGRLRAVEVFDL